MKVIHFVPYYPPERIGGVGELTAGLHRALLAEGHESVVITAGATSRPPVHRIAKGRLGWFVKTALWARTAVRCDVIHCQGGEALPLILALALRRNRGRIVVTFHLSYAGVARAFRPYCLEGRTFAKGFEPWFYRNVVCALHRLIDRVTVALCDEVVSVCETTARDILGQHRQDAPNVVYCGLESRADSPADASVAPIELLYVGQGGHRKRVNALPFVLDHVRREVPDARMRIVGFDLESEPQLKALFEERGLLAQVECAGEKQSRDLAPYYQSARCLVAPSAHEGLPIVILEAMQSGLPVVATRVGGNPEAIQDGVSGFLVDVDDPAQMAARCVQLLKDPALRQRMGDAARKTIEERFTMACQVQGYLAVYGCSRDQGKPEWGT